MAFRRRAVDVADAEIVNGDIEKEEKAPPDLGRVEPGGNGRRRPSLVLLLVLTIFGSWLLLFLWRPERSSADGNGQPLDLELKYNVLSSWVQWSNQLLWRSATAGETMHQAIGSPPDPTKLDAVVVGEAAQLLAQGCRGDDRSRPVRVFDAGSGWGGTSFALERGLGGSGGGGGGVVHVDGVTLSTVQQARASELARARGVADRVRFHTRSYDDGAVEPGGRYDLAVSIEALVHSRDVARSLSAIRGALNPAEPACNSAHLIIVEDVLVVEKEEEEEEAAGFGGPPLTSSKKKKKKKGGGGDDDAAVLQAYKTHWAGWASSPFPLTEAGWRRALTGGGDHAPAATATATTTTTTTTPLKLLDLGASHGLRLHGARRLAASAALLGALHAAVAASGLAPRVESYLSSYVGAIARERLLVAGRIKYALLSVSTSPATSGLPPGASSSASATGKSLLRFHAPREKRLMGAPDALVGQCGRPGDPAVGHRRTVRIANASIPGRHLHRRDGCISSAMCCGRAPPGVVEGRGDSGSGAATARAGPGANPYHLETGDYMRVFGRQMQRWFAERGYDGAHGTFLDVGGTGNTRAGMAQTPSKFAQFAGPLQYWVQDVDPRAASLARSFVCDIGDCPAIPDCSFDVVFSHVVLEHVKEPWKAVDTISRITKPGGVSLHVVPFVHRFETILPHYFHFTHQGVASLFEDRGFDVLEVGYDFCVHKAPSKPAHGTAGHHGSTPAANQQLTENWLVYIVARKRELPSS